MSTDSSRSEQVVDDYKKRKVAASALRRIQELILGFEADRAADRRLARFGVVIILAIIGVAAYFMLSADRLTLF